MRGSRAGWSGGFSPRRRRVVRSRRRARRHDRRGTPSGTAPAAAPVGAWIRSPPSGTCTTGRSLSGIVMNRGESSRGQLVEADAVGGEHLVGVRTQLHLRARPHDHRGDDVAGAGLVVVELAEHARSAAGGRRPPRRSPAVRPRPPSRPRRCGRRAAPTVRRASSDRRCGGTGRTRLLRRRRPSGRRDR